MKIFCGGGGGPAGWYWTLVFAGVTEHAGVTGDAGKWLPRMIIWGYIAVMGGLYDFRKSHRGRGGGGFGKRKPGRGGGPGWMLIFLLAAVAGVMAFWAYDRVWHGAGVPQVAGAGMDVPDRESAHFGTCNGPVRRNCVVDGDTFWYAGRKIRIADINTPELDGAQCDYERQLGERAKARLRVLLNQGNFTLETIDRDKDRYGRDLRIVTRGGESLGDILVAEGLAEEWQGYRRYWC